MRRLSRLLVLGLLATAGCTIVDHGGDLPPNRAYADELFYDPWNGTDHPLLPDHMRRL